MVADTKFEYLTEVVDYFCWKKYDEGALFALSDSQREQLEEARDHLRGYSDAGESVADMWLECADELLN